ncbi:HdeA/HdeB family chaperone [Salinarimonas soli]|uniref:HdeA/HdeB family protein n=1 Tax=Salinarimonas soli TaxID=1638099 RepID=A0A5B2W062_9HYPH|nr:HdeA/HdeB family chaperone [Salinarimonas soli]KAA2243972.1 hypothetical protein F0L46_01615 [Salinarimonas soli]
MCRKGFVGLSAAVLAMLTGPGAAQVADLRQASCAQFLEMPAAERTQLALWLHGYYAGAAQRSSLDRGKLEEGAGALQQACSQNRAMPLIGIEARAALMGEPNPLAPPPSPPAAPAPQVAPASPAATAPAAPGRPTPLR